MTYVLLFAVLAVMRTAQAVSAKYSSALIQDNRTLLHAGGFSNIVSALVALVALIVANDFSCDAFTVLTAAACGLCITLATLTQYVSLRQSTIALNTMFGTASMLLPSIAGMFSRMLVMQIIGVFQVMYEPLTMTDGGPNNASISLMLTSYFYGFRFYQAGRAAAVGTITFLFLIGLTFLYFYLQRKNDN